MAYCTRCGNQKNEYFYFEIFDKQYGPLCSNCRQSLSETLKTWYANFETDRETMSVKDAAEYLKISHLRVYQLIKEGKLKAIKRNGTWRIDAESVRQRFDFFSHTN